MRKGDEVNCLTNIYLINGLRVASSCTLHNSSASYPCGAAVTVCVHTLRQLYQVGQAASISSLRQAGFREIRITGQLGEEFLAANMTDTAKASLFSFPVLLQVFKQKNSASGLLDSRKQSTESVFQYLNRAGLFLGIIKAAHFQPELFKFFPTLQKLFIFFCLA